MTIVRAALAQVGWAGDRAAMLTRLERAVGEAAESGAHVVAFPELCTTTYYCTLQDPQLRQLAEPVPGGPTITRLSSIARASGIVIVVPLAEQDTDGRCYNSTAVIDADGRLAGCYRKQHLPHFPGGWERFYFQPGDRGFPAFDTAAGRIGVAICWDRFYPETWRALALAGAQIIFNPIATRIKPTDRLATLVQPAAAFANQVFAGVINRAGRDSDGQEPYPGGSYFTGPSGDLLTPPATGQEQLVVADLDLGRLGDARRDWPFYPTRRPCAYQIVVTRRAPPASTDGQHQSTSADPAFPSPERIEQAAVSIEPTFTGTPQWTDDTLNTELGTQAILKLETLNPLRCFKGRGADWYLSATTDITTPLVCASAGNFGQAMAYAARRRGLPITVFAATGASPVKVARMRELGATVHLDGHDFDAAKQAARSYASAHGWRFVEDGAEPAIAEGAGTIALELGAWPGQIDAIVVPVGNGALITGIGTWYKARSPQTQIIGVCATGAPAMANSWTTGIPAPTDKAATIADGIAVREPIPYAVQAMTDVVDNIVTVTDTTLIQATRLLWHTLRLAIEPAGAAGIAALLARPHLGHGRTIATPLCGASITDTQAQQWLLASPLTQPPHHPDLKPPRAGR